MLSPISEKLCSAHPIKYSEILELDRAVREFDTHPNLDGLWPEDKLKMWSEAQRLRPRIVGWYKELGRHISSIPAIILPLQAYSTPLYPSERLRACSY